jgi:hypothetical protein
MNDRVGILNHSVDFLHDCVPKEYPFTEGVFFLSHGLVSPNLRRISEPYVQTQ